MNRESFPTHARRRSSPQWESRGPVDSIGLVGALRNPFACAFRRRPMRGFFLSIDGVPDGRNAGKRLRIGFVEHDRRGKRSRRVKPQASEEVLQDVSFECGIRIRIRTHMGSRRIVRRSAPQRLWSGSENSGDGLGCPGKETGTRPQTRFAAKVCEKRIGSKRARGEKKNFTCIGVLRMEPGCRNRGTPE